MTWSVVQADAVDWLRSLGDESVDLVVTDPAYESLEKHRAVGTTTRLKAQWFDIFANERFPALLSELYRVLKPNTHMYMFCDQETMFVVKPMAEAAGFRFWKPLVWDKVQIGMGYHYRARYEFILFFEKGKRRLTDLGMPDVLQATRVNNGYPTEKPVSISSALIQQSSAPGELVIDPFTGSGSVGAAALMNDRHFAGCDTSAGACLVAGKRLGLLDTGRSR